MNPASIIFVAGHKGLLGSALCSCLQEKGYTSLLTRERDALELTNQKAVIDFFSAEKPDYVFLCAARVGGIQANMSRPVEFIYENLAIQTNVIHAAFEAGVQRLVFFGSTCAYPKECPQPMKVAYLWTGLPEPTSEPYSTAKLAGLTMCAAYNRQYGTSYITVIPSTLYGPGDHFDAESSHVLSALIHKFHTAVSNKKETVTIWGSGDQRREFLYSQDCAEACAALMKLDEKTLHGILGPSRYCVNAGGGSDISIKDLAQLIADITGFKGTIKFDTSQPEGTQRKLLDSSVINHLGWKPRVTLEEGIRRTYEWYVHQQDRLCCHE